MTFVNNIYDFSTNISIESKTAVSCFTLQRPLGDTRLNKQNRIKTIQEGGKFKKSNKNIAISKIIVALNVNFFKTPPQNEKSNISVRLAPSEEIDYSFFFSCIWE